MGKVIFALNLFAIIQLPRDKKGWFALLLSGVFFSTNILFAQRSQSNFWEERQKAIQKMKQESDLLENLASASLQTPKQYVSHLNQEQYQLLAQLPQVTKLNLASSNNAPLSSNINVILSNAKNLNPKSKIQNPNIKIQNERRNELNKRKERRYSDSWLSAILPYGSIKDIYISKSPAAPLVIHIQDVHGVLEAQKNIANITTAIVNAQRNRSPKTEDRKPKTDGEFRTSDFGSRSSVVIGLEGASGLFNLHPYRNFPDAGVTRDIAEYFLKEGYIGGPEFAGLTAPEMPLMLGVEDISLYEANIKAIYDSKKNKPVIESVLTKLKVSAEQLKEKSYSTELKEFDKHFNAYKNEQEKLGEYVRYLFSTLTSISTYSHSNLNLFLKALKLEESVDFEEVEKERIKLVEILVERLSEKQLTELIQESVAHRAGHVSYAGYYQYIKKLCRVNKIPVEELTKLDSYINYVLLAERINREKLLDELIRLEEAVQNPLAVTTEQKRLVAATKGLILLEKLTNHEMTTDDWEYYDRHREGIFQSLSFQQSVSGNPVPLKIKSLLPPFEDFCRYATQRNSVLVENLLGQVKNETENDRVRQVKSKTGKDRNREQHNSNSVFISTFTCRTLPHPSTCRISVLIAGGFHTQGLTQILRQKDVSYVVVTPKITEVPKDSRYLDVFARDPLPLEKLFAGEKIFMVYPLGLAVTSLPGFRKEADRFKKWILSAEIARQLDNTDPKNKDGIDKLIAQLAQNAKIAGFHMRVVDFEFESGHYTRTDLETKNEDGEMQIAPVVTADSQKQKVVQYLLAKRGLRKKLVGTAQIGEKVLLFYSLPASRHVLKNIVKNIVVTAQKQILGWLSPFLKGAGLVVGAVANALRNYKSESVYSSYAYDRSRMTHLFQKKSEMGLAVRYVGSWNVRKEKGMWNILRIPEDAEWGEDIQADSEERFKEVLQRVLNIFPSTKDFRIIIGEGYGPLGTMDLNNGILYLDSSILGNEELAEIGLDHELYHWNNPEAEEKIAVQRTLGIMQRMEGKRKEGLIDVVTRLYGGEVKGWFSGKISAEGIAVEMEAKKGLEGIQGRVEYFRKRDGSYWMVIDGEVEYMLPHAPSKPEVYNAIQKWTPEGLDIIREMMRARTLDEHVLLVGEAGVGKDWLAMAYSELMGQEHILLSLSEETEAQDFIAWRGLRDGLTVWEYSQIVEAYREGKIIIVDEVTKTRPGARAILNAIMQDAELHLPGKIVLPDGTETNVVKRGKGFQIIATMNPVNERYHGFELGEDFEDRFGAILEVKELPKERRIEFLKRGLSRYSEYDSNTIPDDFLQELIEMQKRINTSGKVWRKMSLRVLERIVEAMIKHPDEDLEDIIKHEYRIGEWEEGRDFVEREIRELVKKEFVEKEGWEAGRKSDFRAGAIPHNERSSSEARSFDRKYYVEVKGGKDTDVQGYGIYIARWSGKYWSEIRLEGEDFPYWGVATVSWSRDGKHLAGTVGKDVYVWENIREDLDSGRQLKLGRKLKMPAGYYSSGSSKQVRTVSWSQDRRFLRAVTFDEDVVIEWQAPSVTSSLFKRAIAQAERQYSAPQLTDDKLVSDGVAVELSNDEYFPGLEYEYAPKETPTGNRILHQILRGISLNRNILLIGHVGTGKSWLVKALFRMLRKKVEHMSFHEATTTRDLTAWPKTTRKKGGDISTELELSPLARAMLEGRPFIGDEVNRASPGVLAVLNHALQFRELILPVEIELPDGTSTRRIKAKEGFSMVLTSNPPGGRVEVNYLMADFMDRMFTIEVDYMPEDEEINWLENIWYEKGVEPDENERNAIKELVSLAGNSRKLARDNKARAISPRTLERVMRFRRENPEEGWVDILLMMSGVEGALDADLRESLEGKWESKFGKIARQRGPPQIEVSEDNSILKIDNRTWDREDSSIKSRYFKGFEENDRIIELMAKMRSMGEHVLLVGEAGVGKDWLAMAYSELMGQEHILLSLSEETEAQDFIAWRGLRDGLTVWEYSQIVDAYREGKIIIIDEVTKTRPGARAILNEIMISPELELPDGSRVKRGKGFQIIATMNEANERYGGYELGEDFEDRFGAILEVKELAKERRIEFLKRGLSRYSEYDSNTIPDDFLQELIEMQKRINTSGKVWRKMSLRVLERIVEAMIKHPDEDLEDIIKHEYRIGEWEEGRDFVEREIRELVKKEFVEDKRWMDGSPLAGPTNWVLSTSMTPDGRYIVSGGEGGEVFVWVADKNQPGVRLAGPLKRVESTSMTPDGRYIVSGGEGGEVFVWVADSNGKFTENQPGVRLAGPLKRVLSTSMTPDGRYIVSGGDGGEVFVWAAGTDGRFSENQPGVRLAGPNERVSSTSMTPDGRYIVSGGNYGIFIWAADSEGKFSKNQQGVKLAGPTDWVLSTSMTPDGRYIVSGGRGGEVFVWAADTDGKFSENQQGIKLAGPTDWVRLTSMAPDGRYIVTGGGSYRENGEVFVWAADTDGKFSENQQGVKLASPTAWVQSTSMTPDGRYIVSGGAGGEVFVWKNPIGKRSSILERAGSTLAKSYEKPQIIGVIAASPHPTLSLGERGRGEGKVEDANLMLVSDGVSVKISDDEGYPGSEYDYTPKETPTGNRILHQILRGISLNRNILLIGPVGTGKSWLVKALFRMLRKKVEHMSFHEATTTRDLTVWPKTTRKPGGDISTEPELSPLARAMLEGRPFIGDEVNRASPGVLAVLNHALQFRELILPVEIELPDGTRTRRIKAKEGFSMVLTSNPPGGRVEVNYLMADFMDRMYTIEVDYMPEDEEINWLERIWAENVKEVKPDDKVHNEIKELVSLAGSSRKLARDNKARAISPRTLERVIRYKRENPEEEWVDILLMTSGVEGALDADLRESLERKWESKFEKIERQRGPPQIEVSGDKRILTIGGKTWDREDINVKSRYFKGFEENDRIIELMAKMRTMGEHVLLVGEAGVGKDWLAMAYSELMGQEHILLSLSEETEAQDFIAWRGLRDGLTVWEYSQIVDAYREGKIIIIDEVTKTRPGARAILNEIMISPELELPDGSGVKRGKGFQIIATMNEANERYGGYELGEDFEDRFGAILEVKELAKERRIEFLKRGLSRYSEYDSNTIPDDFLQELIEMQERINTSGKVWRKMSLRVLERIVEAMVKHPEEDLEDIIKHEYRIGEWDEGRDFVEKEIREFLKKEFVKEEWWEPGLQLKWPDSNVLSVSWSPNNRYLVSGGLNGEVNVWESDIQYFKLSGPSSIVESVSWSPNSKHLASSGRNGEVYVWNLDDKGNFIKLEGTRLPGPDNDGEWSISWSPDSRHLVTGRNGHEVYVWNLDDKGNFIKLEGTRLSGPDSGVWSISWSPDSKHLATGWGYGEVYVWNLNDESNFIDMEGTKLTGPYGAVSKTLHWSPSSRHLVAVDEDGNAYVWNLDAKGDFMELEGTRLPGPYHGVVAASWSPDGRHLATARLDNYKVLVWDIDDEGNFITKKGTRLIGPSRHKDLVVELASWSPNSKHLTVVDDSGKVYVWNLDDKGNFVTLKGTRLVGPGGDVNSVIWSPDSKHLASKGDSDEVYVWDLDDNDNFITARGTSLQGTKSRVWSVSWSSDSKHLASGGLNAEVFIWKTPHYKGSIIQRAKTAIEKTYEAPRVTRRVIANEVKQSHEIASSQAPRNDGQLVLESDGVSVEISDDEGYPGPEYEYAPKETPTGNRILHQILRGISLNRNILLIGPVGTGKSWLVKALFRMLHKKVEHMSFHEATTTRDLTAWPKTTRKKGGDISTELELSPLARAMLEGRPFIGDEVNRASAGVLAVLNHALQFRELILPVEIELPDGTRTRRIKAKEGFSLVLTMNPPGGRVEVNYLMADFMDRMYTVEVDYMPEDEEVDLLMRIAGTSSEELKRDITTLVRYANNMRKTNPKKPSFRVLERVVLSLKKYPNQDPVYLQGLKMGVALQPEHEMVSLTRALSSKQFGESFTKVWQGMKQIPLIPPLLKGEIGGLFKGVQVALSIGLANGQSKDKGEEKYNPNRWWEYGNPGLPEQRRARERRNVLEKIMQLTTGLGIHLKAWYELPQAGELGKMKTWRVIWDTKDMKPKEMNFVAEDMINPSSEESVLGVLYHELFELLYRHPEATAPEFLVQPGAAVLDNAIGDIWINKIGTSAEEFPGSKDWLMARYQEKFSLARFDNSLEEAQRVMASQPLYLQFGLGMIYEWVWGRPDPTILNEDVKKAIEALRDKVDDVHSTMDVAEHKRKTKELYETEEFQALVKKSVEEKAQADALGLEGEGDRVPWESLSDEQKKEMLEKLKELWDKLTPEEKEQLLKEAAERLTQEDKNRPDLNQPVITDQDGNPLDDANLDEFRKGLMEAVHEARREQENYDEEQELKRMEEEMEAAERAKEERDREGITEGQQQDYEARYERVRGDVKKMQTVFRKFLQRQKGYWQRWLEKGILDDAALPLAVAGEDRIFKKRKLPKQYKVRISLLIDQSGSMDGNKIEAVADAVLMMLLALQDDQNKGITLEVVGFHDDKPMEIYFKYGEKITKQKIVEVIAHAAKTYGGNADLRAMFFAFKRIPLHEPNMLNLVIHFSDGDPNFQFSRDRFREFINKRRHIVVVGLGIGKGAELILDLYPKGQGVWAETTREVPDKVRGLLEKFVGRHGRNGPETIRYSKQGVSDVEARTHAGIRTASDVQKTGKRMPIPGALGLWKVPANWVAAKFPKLSVLGLIGGIEGAVSGLLIWALSQISTSPWVLLPSAAAMYGALVLLHHYFGVLIYNPQTKQYEISKQKDWKTVSGAAFTAGLSLAAILVYLWLPWDLLPHMAQYGNNVLLGLFVSGMPHGLRNRRHEKFLRNVEMPNVVETDIKMIQQVELLEAVFPKAKSAGVGELDSHTIKFGFDTVRLDVRIGESSPVDGETMDRFKVFVKDAGEALHRSLIIQENWIPIVTGMTADADIGDMEFNQALILARSDENFRKFVALDIMSKLGNVVNMASRDSSPPNKSEAQNDKIFKAILSETALLRVSGSSLFEELDRAAGKDRTAGKDREKERQDYLKQDARFLVQTAFVTGLLKDISGKKLIEALDNLFNSYYDDVLRRAMVFDAARQLIAKEALKTAGNYLVFDVSELFDEKVKDEQKARMIAMLSHLANILEKDKEALKGKIALVSNRRGINDRNLLLELVQRYPGLNAVNDVLEKNLSDGNLVIKTSDSNQEIVVRVNGENKISLNNLVNSLGGRAVAALELFTLSKKNIHDDLTAELKQNISMIIIDLMTDTTVQIQEELQKTRFVTIQA